MKETSVFRFRKVTDYAIEELIYDELVGTTNDLLNDPYDCKFYYDHDTIKDFIVNNASKRMVEDLEKTFKVLDLDTIINLSAAELEKITSTYNFTLCFSKNINKEIMWSHYADLGRGFAIEYDFDSLKKKIAEEKKHLDSIKRRTAGLFKVNYVRKRNNQTEFLKNFIMFCILNNRFMKQNEMVGYRFMYENAKKIYLEKNSDWKYESEWRILWPNEKYMSGHKRILDLKPISLYIGENCSKKDKFLLCSIAYKKNIKLYQMESLNTCGEYKLVSKIIDEEAIGKILNHFEFSMMDAYKKALKKHSS